jgi:chaperonin GroEL
VAVKAPGFGDRRKAMLRTSRRPDRRQLIAEELGIKLENVTLATSGARARVVVTTRRHTTIVGGAGGEAIEGRCQELRRRSRTRRPTTTARSSRSGWRSCPAASR